MTATRPATAPEAPPSRLGLPLEIVLGQQPGQRRGRGRHEGVDHRQRGRAAGLERRAGVEAEPADPQQRARRSGSCVSEWGGIASLPKPTRLPTISAPTSPAMPALMCTTVPPAKSSAPHWKARPALAVTASNGASAPRLGVAAPAAANGLAGGDRGGGTGPVPDHVRDREVDEGHPQRDEQRDGRELHALGHRADDQRRRDGRQRSSGSRCRRTRG